MRVLGLSVPDFFFFFARILKNYFKAPSLELFLKKKYWYLFMTSVLMRFYGDDKRTTVKSTPPFDVRLSLLKNYVNNKKLRTSKKKSNPYKLTLKIWCWMDRFLFFFSSYSSFIHTTNIGSTERAIHFSGNENKCFLLHILHIRLLICETIVNIKKKKHINIQNTCWKSCTKKKRR